MENYSLFVISWARIATYNWSSMILIISTKNYPEIALIPAAWMKKKNKIKQQKNTHRLFMSENN